MKKVIRFIAIAIVVSGVLTILGGFGIGLYQVAIEKPWLTLMAVAIPIAFVWAAHYLFTHE